MNADLELTNKLNNLYNECLKELLSIGIDITESQIGEISINLSNRNNKRYGCCKQEDPDYKYKIVKVIGRRRCIKYERYNKHTIEISNWVMKLDDKIIKNTIIHEIIHCIPFCNNHGKNFKKYANYINLKLGYNITTLGNKKEDFEKSNLEYNYPEYKYVIKCTKCGKMFYRNRLNRNFFRKYRCTCNGKLEICQNC